MSRFSLALFSAIAFLLMFSCKKKDMPLTRQTPKDLDTIAANYYEEYLKLHPLEATSQGDSRYNDQLPIDIDKDFIAGEIAFYAKILDQLKGVDYKSLSDDRKVIYDVLDATLKDRIENKAYHFEYIPFTQFSGLPLDFPLLGSGQGSQPFKTTEDYDNWLKRVNQFPVWMDAAIANFNEGIRNETVLPKKLVVKMIPQMQAEEIITTNMDKNIFYGPVKNFPSGFSQQTKDKYAHLYREAITQKIIPAYQKMGNFLENEYLPKSRETDGINALPNGASTYQYLIRSWTTTDMTPEEIHKTGLQEVARIRKEMEAIKAEVGFSGTLEEFLNNVKEDPKAMPYKTSEQVLGAFQGILARITPGLKKNV